MEDGRRLFSDLYHHWLLASRREKEQLYAELKRSYRQAWNEGDVNDRGCVLTFILFGEIWEAKDIAICALQDEDDSIALDAEGVVTGLIRRGIVGSEVRASLEALQKRFPDRPTTGLYALLLLSNE